MKSIHQGWHWLWFLPASCRKEVELVKFKSTKSTTCLRPTRLLTISTVPAWAQRHIHWAFKKRRRRFGQRKPWNMQTFRRISNSYDKIIPCWRSRRTERSSLCPPIVANEEKGKSRKKEPVANIFIGEPAGVADDVKEGGGGALDKVEEEEGWKRVTHSHCFVDFHHALL